MPGGGQFRDRISQSPCHGWRGPNHAIVPHDANLQPLLLRLLPITTATALRHAEPGQRQAPGVAQPRTGARHGAAVGLDVAQRPRQGPVDALHRLLAREAAAAADGGEAAERGPEGVDACAGGGDPQ